MKKKLFIILIILLVTACSKNNKMICTMDNDTEKQEIILTIKNDIVEKEEIKISYDLSKYDEEKLKIFNESNICSNIKNYIGFSLNDCKQTKKNNKFILSGTLPYNNEKISKIDYKQNIESIGYICK